MTDFYEAERFKIELALAIAVVVYPITIFLLWVRLKHLYGSYVYAAGNGGADRGQPESFVAWLSPWCISLSIMTIVGLSVMVFLIYRFSFSGKDLCVDCLAISEQRLRNFTASYDDIARQYVCPDHLEERRDRTAFEAATERARAENVGMCPRCGKPMRKALQKVLGIWVVSDICQAHGRFSDWGEEELFYEEAYQAGLHDQRKPSVRRGMDRRLAGVTVLHSVHADTAPIFYIDELAG